MKAAAVLSVILLVALPAQAGTLKLGTADGGMMIYYNNLDVSGASGGPDGTISGYDENPSNQAYLKFQFGYGNANGMAFQFDPTDLGGWNWNDIFSGAPVGSSQFGLDFQTTAPTYSSGGGVSIPGFDFADNADNTVAGATHTTVIPTSDNAWAIADYKEPSGPAAGTLINSTLRGTGLSLSVTSFSVTQDTDLNGATRDRLFTLGIAGTMTTDGYIHWYSPSTPDTDLTTWGLSDELYFEGSLTYDAFYGLEPWGTGANTYSGLHLENGSDQRDFYAGQIDVYFQTVPLPGSAPLGLALLSLLGGATLLWRRRRATEF